VEKNFFVHNDHEDLTPHRSLHHFAPSPTATAIHNPNPRCTVATAQLIPPWNFAACRKIPHHPIIAPTIRGKLQPHNQTTTTTRLQSAAVSRKRL